MKLISRLSGYIYKLQTVWTVKIEFKAVINLSTKTVEAATQAVLNKGLNFVIAPTKI